MLIAQLTDCHVVAPGEVMADRFDTAPALARAVEVVNAMRPRPDLVLATGDLVNDARAAEYDRLVELLAPLEPPVLPCPGNHDDRSELRRRFPILPPGDPDDPIDHVVDDLVPGQELVLVGLDTTIPGSNAGRITAAQSEWLATQLAARRDRPVLVFQHHPPFASGIPWMDRDCGFDGADREAAALAGHPAVEGVVCGHLHRAMHRRFGGTVASTCPSTGPQLELDLLADAATYTTEPPAVALHRFVPGDGLTTHLVPVVDAERWTPRWAAPAPSGRPDSVNGA